MKNFSFLSIALFAFCILFFTSCKKDDELSTKDKFIGKWTYETIKSTEYENGTFVESETEAINGATIEFKANGTYDAIFADEDGDLEEDSGTWKLIDNDKKVIVGEQGSSFGDTLSIEELTDKKLRLLYEDEYTEDGITYRFENEVSFKK
jgi:hypothetical protein